jgi:hypothetical protein
MGEDALHAHDFTYTADYRTVEEAAAIFGRLFGPNAAQYLLDRKQATVWSRLRIWYARVEKWPAAGLLFRGQVRPCGSPRLSRSPTPWPNGCERPRTEGNETTTETRGDLCLIRDARPPGRRRVTAYERPGPST